MGGISSDEVLDKDHKKFPSNLLYFLVFIGDHETELELVEIERKRLH